MRMRAALIVNPAAGRGTGHRLAPAIHDLLHSLGVSAEIHTSRSPGDVAACVQAALAEAPDVVAVAGGDGTVHEAVNGWMRAGGGAPLAVIPAGTGNDFMKMFGAESGWRTACQRIAAGRTRRVDLGRCNDFYFANGLGIGFDAQVARAANHIHWLRGNAIYGVALLKVLLFEHQRPRVRLRQAADTFETDITLIAVQNGRVEGGKFLLAPRAEMDDGALDVVLAAGMGRIGLLRLVPRVLRGTHLAHPKVTAFRSTALSIESDAALPVHADGEIYAPVRHFDIAVLPRALTLIA